MEQRAHISCFLFSSYNFCFELKFVRVGYGKPQGMGHQPHLSTYFHQHAPALPDGSCLEVVCIAICRLFWELVKAWECGWQAIKRATHTSALTHAKAIILWHYAVVLPLKAGIVRRCTYGRGAVTKDKARHYAAAWFCT